jgi:hypothetical protein
MQYKDFLYELAPKFIKAFTELHLTQEEPCLISVYDSQAGNELAAYFEFYYDEEIKEESRVLFVSFREDITQALRTKIISWLAVECSKYDIEVEYHTDFHYESGAFVSGTKAKEVLPETMSFVTYISEEPLYGYGFGGRYKQNR